MIKLLKGLKHYKLPIFINFLFLGLVVATELFLPKLMADIVNIGVQNGDTGYILKTGLLMLCITIIGTAFSIYAGYLSSKTALGFTKDLRKKIFHKASYFSLNEINTIGTASLITRTTNDVTQIQSVVIMLLRMAIRAPLMAIGGIVVAVTTDLSLSLVLIVAIIVLGSVIGLIASKALPLFSLMQKKVDRLNLVLRERLTGIRVIRSFNKTTEEQQRFDNANKDLTDIAITANKLMALAMPFIFFIMNVTTVAVIWFGAIRVDAGTMLVGDVIAFMQYATLIMFSVVMLTMLFIMLPRAFASAKRINEVLDTEPSIIDSVPSKAESKLSKDASHSGHIVFDHVSFSYDETNESLEPVLQDISFETKPGEVTAIIGGTGSGKSTIINLITRFYDITKGSIRIDGMDIRDIPQEELRNKLGLVPQKAILFSGDIKKNIRFGNDHASENELMTAAKTAQAYEFISKMPSGFDTAIAQDGTNISGGQKQRLSIARALVRKPAIFLFDDSFSALDFKTDAKLRKALKAETKTSTMIIVAQRVTTVMDADQIIVLDDGKIVGKGTHKSLMNDCDVYKEIVASQLSEEELA